MKSAAGDALRDLFLLRPDVVFLNHGSFGACPRAVFDVYQRMQLELESQPVLFLDREFRPRMAAAREALARYVGADTDDLVYVPNATTAVNIVARSLPLDPGDEILTTDLEYGAIDRAWESVAQRRGARIARAEIPVPVDDPDDVVAAIWSRVTERTRVLSISHIAYLTALILPIETLVQRARDAGILTLIDGAHAPGQIPLSLDELGADFYAGNCHKWMLAPKGAGFLHARRAVQPLLEPLVVSWGWESRMPGASRFVDHHEWQGTRDIAAYLAVPAAIDFMEAARLGNGESLVLWASESGCMEDRGRDRTRSPLHGQRELERADGRPSSPHGGWRCPEGPPVRRTPRRDPDREVEGALADARLDPGLQLGTGRGRLDRCAEGVSLAEPGLVTPPQVPTDRLRSRCPFRGAPMCPRGARGVPLFDSLAIGVLDSRRRRRCKDGKTVFDSCDSVGFGGSPRRGGPS